MDKKQSAIDGILSGRSFRMGDWETVKAIVSEAYDAGKADAEAPEQPLAYWEVNLLEEAKNEPQVGEVLTVAQIQALPEGAVVADKDGDTYVHQSGKNWLRETRFGEPDDFVTTYVHEGALHGPYTLASTPQADELWGFKVGDRVQYTDGSAGFLGDREVIEVYPNGGPSNSVTLDNAWDTQVRIELGDPSYPDRGHVGTAYGASEIRLVG